MLCNIETLNAITIDQNLLLEKFQSKIKKIYY